MKVPVMKKLMTLMAFIEFGLGGKTDNYPSNLQLLKLIGKGVYSNFTKETICP